MRVLLLEPYYSGSHAAWARGLMRHSRHEIGLLSLKGCYWKWRMHGGAVSLARQFLRTLEREGRPPELILATDMLDLTTFLALTRAHTAGIPAALYMHENQLTYPLQPGEKRDLHYGFINFASALSAQRVFFNSAYHMEAFFDELPRLLKHFPDYNELGSVRQLQEKSVVLPLGVDLRRLDRFRPAAPPAGPALILWNHRWEYDKNPGDFFCALVELAQEGLDFEVALAGQNYRQQPGEFEAGRRRLAGRIRHFGFADDPAAYAGLLWRADILPVTSHHDFFGVSLVEAMYCGAFPLVPDRLTYPDMVGRQWSESCVYTSQADLVSRLRELITGIDWVRSVSLRDRAQQFDWGALAGEYDRQMEEAASLIPR